MAEVFFTSDLHFNHPNILHFCGRPWDSLEEMNEGLVDNWNSVVGPNDICYLLGDACMGDRWESVQYLKRLQGKIKWIPGNHDYWHPVHKKSKQIIWLKEYSKYAELLECQVEFEEFLLCHFPYRDVLRHEEKWSAWLPEFRGKWLLHGHVHSPQAWDLERPHSYDVGVDANDYKPVSIDFIREAVAHYEKLEMQCLNS